MKKNQIEILEIRILANKIKYSEYAEQQIQLKRKMVTRKTALGNCQKATKKKLKTKISSKKSTHTKNRISRFNIYSKEAGSGEIREKGSRYSWVSTQKPAAGFYPY